MLCRRSASLTRSTRASSAMASRSLRKFSACCACLVTKSSLPSLVRPSTSPPISSPNALSISSRVTVVSSIVSCSIAAAIVAIVDLELGQDGRDFERMGEIGIARRPLLAAVRLHREDIGAVQQILVGVRIVAADPLHQLVLPHHRL